MAISDKDYAEQKAEEVCKAIERDEGLNAVERVAIALKAAIAHGRETGPGWEKAVRDADAYLDMIKAPINHTNGSRLSLVGRIAMTIQGFAVDRVTTRRISADDKYITDEFGTLVIRFRLEGKERDWRVAGLSWMGEQEARKHLDKWIPKAEYLGWSFEPDQRKS